jgi:long-subunit fatty acid transport protein
MNVKPAISPLAGIAWQPNEADSWSLNYEGVRDHKVATTFQSEMDVGVVKPTIVIDSSASMFYDPETFSLGYAHDYGSGDFLVGVDYERWSRFSGSYLKLDVKQGSNWIQYPLDSGYHDTWVPRVGFTHRFGEDRWSFGYAFKPSPTPSLEKQTNFVDSDRHIVGTGYEVDTRIFGLLDKPVKFDFHLQAHYLIPKDITKENPTDIGGPGYQVKGWVFSYGVNLNVMM